MAAALVPFRPRPPYDQIRTVFTIHNIAYQIQ
jgi:glycogen synthase